MSTSRHFLTSSVQGKQFSSFLVYSSSILVLLGLAMFLFFEIQLSGKIEAEVHDAKRMMAAVTEGIGSTAEKDRNVAITKILTSSVDGSRFSRVKFIPTQGRAIEVGNRQIDHVDSPQWIQALVQRNLTEFNHLVEISPKISGEVHLSLSMEKLAGELWRALLLALTMLLIGFFAGAVLIWSRFMRIHRMAVNSQPSEFEGAGENSEVSSLKVEQSSQRHALDALRNLIHEVQTPGHVEPETDDLDVLVDRITNLIHEREQGLRNLHNQNLALVQHAIVSVTNLNGDIVYANDQFCDISGYSREELLGQNHRIVNSGFHPAEVFSELWHTISSGEVWHGQLQNRNKSGELYWVDVTIAPLKDVNGLPNQYISIRTVITASKNAELEMARQRLALADIIEGTNAGTWEWDTSTGTMTLNERWAQMIGYTLDELGPMNIEKWASFFHPEDLSHMAVQQEQHMNGVLTALAVESRVRHKDGHWVWVLDGGKLTTRENDGRPSLMAGTRMDISVRKRAEIELQRSEQLLRSSIEAIDEAFVLYDADDRLVLCNEKYRSYYPASKELVVPGSRFEDIVRHGAESGSIPDARDRVDEWVVERLAAHRAGDTTQVQRFDDGKILRVIDRHMPDGHTVGLRVDITELVHASEAAEAASLAKSQFLANMSHELRTPMNSVLGMLTLLRKTGLNARQLDYLNKSQGAARSLLGLLNEILDFSKIEAGKMTLDSHPFNSEQLLRDLSVILSSSVGSKPVELIFDIDTSMPRYLVGDAMRLQQVLVNLCGNAIKFTAQGEITLSFKVLRHSAGEVTLEISVNDTGIGIAPENVVRIFSGFTQAEASTTRRFGGTGLGLSISHRLVDLMGGELKVSSVPGQGSSFYFNITLQVDAGKELAGGSSATCLPMRALIVDDNPSACRTFESMLRSFGWETWCANSGEAALSILHEQEQVGRACQVVFMDYEMPVLDGWQTSQRMREMGLSDNVLLIATVTANGAELLAQRSETEHSLLDGFVIKPVTPSMLLDAVSNVHVEASPISVAGLSDVAATKRLENMRLLVVEDNPNNRQLARELLEGEGANVKIVNDGQEAVDVLASNADSFDVVLMDLQMPVMDGITATRAIRRELGQTTLPIVAMTANAMDSDRHSCLSAGMNDHVGKPFELDHLIRVLRKQAGWKDDPKASAPARMTKPADSIQQTADAAGVEIAAALNRMGANSSGVYREALRAMTQDMSAMPKQLRDHVAMSEITQALRVLHTLKGFSATLGATAFSTEIASAEKQLKEAQSSSKDMQNAIIDRACDAISRATPGLTKLLAVFMTESSGAPATMDATPKNAGVDVAILHAELKNMADRLSNADMAAFDMMNRLQQQFGAVLGDKLRPLGDAVAALDFTLASDLCAELVDDIEGGVTTVTDAS